MATRRRTVARTVIDEIHVEVARVFFALPESAGYAVGGGGAALAHDIVHRATDDLDLSPTDVGCTPVRSTQPRRSSARHQTETGA
jgi:hypothetical protein